MNLSQYIGVLKNDPGFMANVTCWKELPARPARYLPFPDSLDARAVTALGKKGITQLYSHQRQAIDAALRGEDVVVVTPTASGKTLCYNLPVLDAILKDKNARALYLFPTKALSADQAAELYSLVELLGEDRRKRGSNDQTSRRLANLMNNLPGWKKSDRKIRVPLYGPQWVYYRQ